MFNVPDDVCAIVKMLQTAGYEAYCVGGCVRDSLLGRPVHDWDICTNALPEQTKAVFNGFRTIETGLKHGTLTIMLNDVPYEITTYRIDGEYTDGRHPDTVEFTSDLKKDLSRRDVTINNLCYCPLTHHLIDEFGGVEDLKNKIIRCVGDPDARFKEDGLRIMRVIRFASVLGFSIEKNTSDAVLRNKTLLNNISVERIVSELNKLLCSDGACDILLRYKDVIAEFIPELVPCFDCEQNTDWHIYDVYTHICKAIQNAPNDLSVRLSLLLHDVCKPQCKTADEANIDHFYGHPSMSADAAFNILKRLKYDNKTIDEVVCLIKHHDMRFDLYDKKVYRRLISKLGAEMTEKLFEVMHADNAAQNPDRLEIAADEALKIMKAMLSEVLEEENCFKIKDLAVNGNDLIELGIKPGPAFSLILNDLLNKVIEEKTENDKEKLIDYIKETYLENDIKGN